MLNAITKEPNQHLDTLTENVRVPDWRHLIKNRCVTWNIEANLLVYSLLLLWRAKGHVEEKEHKNQLTPYKYIWVKFINIMIYLCKVHSWLFLTISQATPHALPLTSMKTWIVPDGLILKNNIMSKIVVYLVNGLQN